MKNRNKVLCCIVFFLLVLSFICIQFTDKTKKEDASIEGEKNTTHGEQTTYAVESSSDISTEKITIGEIALETESTIEMITNVGLESESVTILIHEEFVEPGEGTLDISGILGFTPENSHNETDDEEKGIVLSVQDITVEAVGSYTGNYIEDGSDEPIQNVASIIVTNHSKAMLQVADIEFKVNENEIAKFRVTNLLPSTSVLVLEANKRIYNSSDDYSYGTVATAWINTVSLHEDKFEMTKDDGMLTLKNKTDNIYKKVYVYYKYAQVGGAYLGGITYRVPFENIGANATIQSVANHFKKATSRIIDIQIVE